MTILSRIFQAMEQNGRKATDLAAWLDINQSVISTWKKRNTNPPAEYLVRICEFLGISIEWLLTGQEGTDQGSIWQLTAAQKEVVHDYFPDLTEEQAALLNNYEKLSSRDKREIRGLIEMKLEGNGDGSFNSMTSKSDESGPTKTA